MNRRRCLTIGGVLLAVVLTLLPKYAFAQRTPSKIDEFTKGIRKEFSTARGDSQGAGLYAMFFLILVLLVAALIGLNYYHRRRNFIGIDNPRHLFAELVRAHGLGRAEQRFLRDFADEMDLPDPLPLFIEPKYFLGTLDDDRFAEVKPMIKSLLKKLFGIEKKDASTPDVSTSGLYRGATTIIKRPTEFDE